MNHNIRPETNRRQYQRAEGFVYYRAFL
jgi:hypothetical protein